MKAFIIEVKTPDGIRFAKNRMKLVRVPVFFQHAYQVKQILKADSSPQFFGRTHYMRDEVVKTMIMIEDLDKGLRDSKATRFSKDAALNYLSTPLYVKRPKQALYRIMLSHSKDKPVFFNKGGYSTAATMWLSAGELRTFLSRRAKDSRPSRSDVMYEGGALNKASVVEMAFTEDGLGFKETRITPLMEFYLESPTSRKTWKEANELRSRGSKSFEVFNRNPNYTSDRSEYK